MRYTYIYIYITFTNALTFTPTLTFTSTRTFTSTIAFRSTFKHNYLRLILKLISVSGPARAVDGGGLDLETARTVTGSRSLETMPAMLSTNPLPLPPDLHLVLPFYSAKNAESNGVLHDTIACSFIFI